MSADLINIRVNVSGYQGNPLSLFAVFNPDSGDLLIADSEPMGMGELEGFLHVSTTGQEAACDMLFSETDLSAAIREFFAMVGMGTVTLTPDVQRFNPQTKIEPDGVDERGVKYRLAPDVGNAHVAVLVACFAAHRQRQLFNTMDAMEDLKELAELQAFSIGLPF